MFSDRTNWNLKTNRVSESLARHRASGRPVLDLTASNPTQCGFDYDAPALLNSLCNPEALAYRPDPRGLEVARQAVSAYYAARGNQIPSGDIILTTSTSEAYSFVFRLICNSGDEMLIPVPGYPLFSFLADIQDVHLAPYPLIYDHGWQIDFHALEQAITPRTRGVIVVHPNNPTGHFTKQAEMERLNRICSDRGLAIVTDEVFLDFPLSKEMPATFAGNTAALTFAMSGLSKISGLPQMKAAWLVASGPESLKGEALGRLEMIADTYLSMNAPVQLALPVFLEQRRAFQKQILSRVGENLAALDRRLAAQESCSRLALEGGWYAMLRVPATRPDEDLAIELLESKNVYLHPGHFYDCPGDGYLIVSLITPVPTFAEGIGLLLSMF